MDNSIENWKGLKKILVVLAHPDDPEFFLGATIAKWAAEGHTINYCLLTKGEKGTNNPEISSEEVSKLRQIEQDLAGKVLGVTHIRFLDYEDGYLVPTIETRKQIVGVIRKEKPDVVVSCDPTNYFPRPDYVNHPDHRAAGQIVLDAIFPAAGSRLYFPELLREGADPHMPDELWLSLTANPNVNLDVTAWWHMKIQALLEHKSQIGDKEQFIKRMEGKFTPQSTIEAPQYIEQYKRVIFRR
jgi:LmbE family N-acetylglucosaminyl deacetylase